jgi:hypothetical protein
MHIRRVLWIIIVTTGVLIGLSYVCHHRYRAGVGLEDCNESATYHHYIITNGDLSRSSGLHWTYTARHS